MSLIGVELVLLDWNSCCVVDYVLYQGWLKPRRCCTVCDLHLWVDCTLIIFWFCGVESFLFNLNCHRGLTVPILLFCLWRRYDILTVHLSETVTEWLCCDSYSFQIQLKLSQKTLCACIVILLVERIYTYSSFIRNDYWVIALWDIFFSISIWTVTEDSLTSEKLKAEFSITSEQCKTILQRTLWCCYLSCTSSVREVATLLILQRATRCCS